MRQACPCFTAAADPAAWRRARGIVSEQRHEFWHSVIEIGTYVKTVPEF